MLIAKQLMKNGHGEMIEPGEPLKVIGLSGKFLNVLSEDGVIVKGITWSMCQNLNPAMLSDKDKAILKAMKPGEVYTHRRFLTLASKSGAKVNLHRKKLSYVIQKLKENKYIVEKLNGVTKNTKIC